MAGVVDVVRFTGRRNGYTLFSRSVARLRGYDLAAGRKNLADGARGIII